jgi:hypothetical protein
MLSVIFCNAECHHAECCYADVIMPNVIMLNVVAPSHFHPRLIFVGKAMGPCYKNLRP